MRIRDLYEANDYKETLNNEIMNIIMMFMKTGQNVIDIENIIAELEKNDIMAIEADIEEFANSNENLSVNQEKQVVFSTSGSGDEDEGRPDLSDEEAYNPASEKAKEATKKRMK
jgi:septum formation topological specificity factor MinE